MLRISVASFLFMNRNEFLKQLGFKGSALLALYCSGACVHDPIIKPVITLDFTIDLKDPANSQLAGVGGFVVANNVVVAQVTTNHFVAASLLCSHQGLPEITFDNSQNIFSCNAHGAAFDLTGKGLNERGKNGLKIYQTSLSGNKLRIFG
jgi:nitrite reductase/ring-hydroxylating ferredoxin subunit